MQAKQCQGRPTGHRFAGLVIEKGPKSFPKFGDRPEELRLDRSRRDMQDLGDFLVFHSVLLDQPKDDLALPRQHGNRFVHAKEELPALHILGRVGRMKDGAGFHIPYRNDMIVREFLQMIQRPVPDRDEQIDFGIPYILQLFTVHPAFHEDIRYHFFRRLFPQHIQQAKIQQFGIAGREQKLERLVIVPATDPHPQRPDIDTLITQKVLILGSNIKKNKSMG